MIVNGSFIKSTNISESLAYECKGDIQKPYSLWVKIVWYKPYFKFVLFLRNLLLKVKKKKRTTFDIASFDKIITLILRDIFLFRNALIAEIRFIILTTTCPFSMFLNVPYKISNGCFSHLAHV